MIRGLDLFREHFADYRKAFVLIGGVACHEWLSTQGLEFRATKDMDMVLIVEAVDAAFVKRFWEFIEAGKYAGRFKADDDRQLYRFDKPADDKYPAMIEIFSRKPSNVYLAEGQQIVPIKLDADSASLSAILLNDDYYELVRQQHNEEKIFPSRIRGLDSAQSACVPRPSGSGCQRKGRKKQRHRQASHRCVSDCRDAPERRRAGGSRSCSGRLAKVSFAFSPGEQERVGRDSRRP